MSLYSYQKETYQKPLSFNPLKLASIMLLMSGLALLGYITWTFVSLGVFTKNDLVSSSLSLLASKNLGDTPQVLSAKDTQKVIWDRFYLSIPKLGIEKARVTTDVESDKKEIYFPILSNSLAHYKGTSYPAEFGDVFIYGHSILPVFFDPKNYISIFSTIHTLQSGDEIDVYWGEEKFVYLVYESVTVDPESLDAINFKDSEDKTLTLMTCSPPGTFLKRLLVRSRLVN